MKLMNVKGTYDYMPNDMKIRNNILNILRNNFEKYGYLLPGIRGINNPNLDSNEYVIKLRNNIVAKGRIYGLILISLSTPELSGKAIVLSFLNVVFSCDSELLSVTFP